MGDTLYSVFCYQVVGITANPDNARYALIKCKLCIFFFLEEQTILRASM